MYLDRKQQLMIFFEKFSGKVCLTSELWSSRQMIEYQCITADFLDDDRKLNKRIILFKKLELHYSGQSLGEAIFTEIFFFEI